jgi:catechol 2,3-dioxygenase-like lactoylglutathione lyase family enzyme
MQTVHHIRIARPVTDLERSREMYSSGLGLRVVGRFVNHDGFDGVMLGYDDAGYHLEFTRCPAHPVAPSPTAEDLLVLYMPIRAQWDEACVRMAAAGFRHVRSLNPYWDVAGRTYEDRDGYRVVLQHGAWRSTDG